MQPEERAERDDLRRAQAQIEQQLAAQVEAKVDRGETELVNVDEFPESQTQPWDDMEPDAPLPGNKPKGDFAFDPRDGGMWKSA